LTRFSLASSVREALETARQIAEAIEATRRTSSTAISMIRDEDDVTSTSSTVVLVMGFAREMRGRTS